MNVTDSDFSQKIHPSRYSTGHIPLVSKVSKYFFFFFFFLEGDSFGVITNLPRDPLLKPIHIY